MIAYLGSALLATIGLAAYHVFQKSIPQDANPALVFIVMYLTGAVLCGGIMWFALPLEGGLASLRRLNAAAVLVALAVLAAEFGTLYMYRSGWDVAAGGLVVNVASAVLLVPIGMIFFGERLSWTRALGITLALAGLILLSLPRRSA